MSIKLTPSTYNGLKVKVTRDIKDFSDPFGQRVIKTGTEGIVTLYQVALGRVKVDFGDCSISIKVSDTEIVYP